ncbi:MAG: hypothetical protein PQJ50_07525 [Spirochaetales bacterium]|nr:hypothetical protein [Spirochaetales bacterium]
MKITDFRRTASVLQKIIYAIYILSFLIATSTHTRDLIVGGFLPYTTKPLWANIYWTALTFADPITIIILLLDLKRGMKLYALIIVSDVIINLYFTITSSGLSGIFNLFMLSQIGFLIFLLITWKRMYGLVEADNQ